MSNGQECGGDGNPSCETEAVPEHGGAAAARGAPSVQGGDAHVGRLQECPFWSRNVFSVAALTPGTAPGR